MKRMRISGGIALSACLALATPAVPQSTQLRDIAVPGGGQSVMSYVLERRAAGSAVEPDAATRVYGGRPAQPGAWPFQVALVGEMPPQPGQADAQPQLGQFCGGSIIARQWILTAAHCVYQPDGTVVSPGKVFVETGTVKLAKGDLRDVAQVIVHEGYDPRIIENDIALIKLAQPIGQSVGPVGAIPVLPQGAPPPQGQGVVIGWGLIDGDKFTEDLMETDLDVLPNDTCNRGMAEQVKRDIGGYLMSLGLSYRVPEDKLEQAFAVLADNIGPSLTENMLCAGVSSGARTSCHGDSGGPLIMRDGDGKWIQVGIVSWGRKPEGATQLCGHEQLYGVYTRVSNYFDWIADKLRNN